MREVDEERSINDGDPQQLFLLQGEQHDEAEAECGQRTDGLLLFFGQLLPFEVFDDLGFHGARIVPRREHEHLRESSEKRVLGKVRSHDGDDQLLLRQCVTQFILNHGTGGGRDDRQHTIRTIDCLLHRNGSRYNQTVFVLRHVHLNAVRGCQCLQPPCQRHLSRIETVAQEYAKSHRVYNSTEERVPPVETRYCLAFPFAPTSGRGSATKPSRFGIFTFGKLLASMT